MWRVMMRNSLAPARLAAITKSSWLGQEPPSHHAGQAVQPMSDRITVIPSRCAPATSAVAGGTEAHPQRNGGDGAQELDGTLDEVVYGAAMVPGGTPDQDDPAPGSGPPR